MLAQHKKSGFSLIEISIIVLIIGILISAITVSSNLFDKSKLSSAQNITYNSPISSISGLVAWYETTLDESIKLDNEENLIKWKNLAKTVNNGDSATITSTNKPQYISKGIADIPSIKFDGSDVVDITSATKFLIGQELSIFIVEDNLDNGIIIGSDNDDFKIKYTASANIDIISNATTFSSNQATNSNAAIHYITLTNSATTLGSDEIVKKGVTHYVNKRMPKTGSMSINNFNDVSATPIAALTSLKIGAALTGYKGNLSEILIFDRKLKRQEAIDVLDYLSSKYSITLSN